MVTQTHRSFYLRYYSNTAIIPKYPAMGKLFPYKKCLSGLIQRMEAKGFIKRETNQGDGRSKYILLTPKAEDIVHEVEMAIDKLEKKVVQDLTEEEQERLRNLLLRTLTILYDCKGNCQCKEEKMD